MQFGRTGFTDLAGWCLASVASAEGYDYMVIVMGCPEKAADGTLNPFYLDTKALYKWAFNSFTYKPVLTKNEILAHVGVNLAWSKDKVPLVPKEEFATVVYNALKSEDILPKITLYKQTVDAPVEKGTVYGKVELYVNLDQKIGEVELVAGESVEQSQILAVWEKVRGFLSSPGSTRASACWSVCSCCILFSISSTTATAGKTICRRLKIQIAARPHKKGGPLSMARKRFSGGSLSSPVPWRDPSFSIHSCT